MTNGSGGHGRPNRSSDGSSEHDSVDLLKEIVSKMQVRKRKERICIEILIGSRIEIIIIE